jgi:hypothetical protein
LTTGTSYACWRQFGGIFLVESGSIVCYLTNRLNNKLTTIHGQGFIIIPPRKGNRYVKMRKRCVKMRKDAARDPEEMREDA